MLSLGRRYDMQDVIPHMAQEYGFDYELITYKWPTWLHKQKEKQRIIWAYKILFLDVIFPISLEKVLALPGSHLVYYGSLFCLYLLSLANFTCMICSNMHHYLQVIFVDADQIVRTDMGELYDMDIKGRPLAYTPFCDNNKDMDGYRFWRQVHSTSHLNFDCPRCSNVYTNANVVLYRVSGKIIYGENHTISGRSLLLLFVLIN